MGISVFSDWKSQVRGNDVADLYEVIGLGIPPPGSMWRTSMNISTPAFLFSFIDPPI
jgi:hypothetical protein